jgi:1-pyrroline-5-carboxylate dehydrogenase
VFGGQPLKNHTIPKKYGAYEPTLIKVPLKHMRSKKKRDLICTELFGPLTVIIEYGTNDIDLVLECINSFPNHLTAAIVSNNPQF